MNTTIINSDSFPSGNEATRIVSNPLFQKSVASVGATQKSKLNKLKTMAGGIAAAGLGYLGFGFIKAPSNEIIHQPIVPSEPKEAFEVSDDMSFQEAFSSAREEVGSGGFFEWHGQRYSTYYKEEWDLLSEDQKLQFASNLNEGLNIDSSMASNDEIIYDAVTIHDTAPVAEHVDDSMSFNDAFALARNEVGPGGVFTWHGETYSTYTVSERSQMNPDQVSEFENSLHQANINPQAIATVDLTQHTDLDSQATDSSNFIGKIDVNGIPADVYEEHGHQIVKIDLDGNGTYDFSYDVNEDLLTNITTGEQINGQEFMASQQASSSEIVPLDTQVVNIEGYNVQFTTFSDGHQEANVDFNNDGSFDAHMNLDNNGNLSVYDMDGNLIHQEQVDVNQPTSDVHHLDTHFANDYDVATDDLTDFDNNANVDDWV